MREDAYLRKKERSEMQEFDFEGELDILEIMLGAKFYTGNAIMNALEGSPVKYTELLDETFLLENTGETKKVNDYAKMFEPAKLDRKNMQ